MSVQPPALLRDFLIEHALPHDAAVLERFARYLELLLRGNRKANLIGPLDALTITRELLCDSLTLAALRWPLPAPVIDIGSGAGLPGLPLALLDPDLPLHIVEPRGRRVHFVGHVARTLGLTRVTRHPERVEAARLPPGGLVCSKAFAPVEQWLDVAAPLTRPGGLVGVLCAAPHWDAARELQAARLGLDVVASRAWQWTPDAPTRRALLLARRLADAPP